jgi:hypothetical protein
MLDAQVDGLDDWLEAANAARSAPTQIGLSAYPTVRWGRVAAVWSLLASDHQRRRRFAHVILLPPVPAGGPPRAAAPPSPAPGASPSAPPPAKKTPGGN